MPERSAEQHGPGDGTRQHHGAEARPDDDARAAETACGGRPATARLHNRSTGNEPGGHREEDAGDGYLPLQSTDAAARHRSGAQHGHRDRAARGGRVPEPAFAEPGSPPQHPAQTQQRRSADRNLPAHAALDDTEGAGAQLEDVDESGDRTQREHHDGCERSPTGHGNHGGNLTAVGCEL